MKKIKNVLFILLMCVFLSGFIGCASGIQKVTKIEDEKIEFVAPKRTMESSSATNNTKEIVNALKEGFAGLNSKIDNLNTREASFDLTNSQTISQPTSLFSNPNNTRPDVDNKELSALKKQVNNNTVKINNVEKTLQLHATAITEGTPPGMGLDPSKKYKIYKISYFGTKCSLLTCGVNCDPSLKDQVDNAMREIKAEGRALVGIFGFASESRSEDSMRNDYLQKKDQELSQARADSIRDRANDLHPAIVKDIKAVGLGSTWFWSSTKQKNQIGVIVAEVPVKKSGTP